MGSSAMIGPTGEPSSIGTSTEENHTTGYLGRITRKSVPAWPTLGLSAVPVSLRINEQRYDAHSPIPHVGRQTDQADRQSDRLSGLNVSLVVLEPLFAPSNHITTVQY